MSNRKSIIFVAMTAAAIIGGSAQAETLNIPVFRPAAVDETALTPVIGIERFSGSDGSMLAQGIESRLQDSSWIDMRMMAPGVDGVLTGSANVSTQKNKTYEERKVCLWEDKKGNCQEKAKVKVECKRRTVSLSAFVRLASAQSGEIYWSRELPRERSVVQCPDEYVASDESMARDMIAEVADEVAAALVPYAGRTDMRVRESRKGLPADEADRFKDILRLTKSDELSACDQWDEMAARLSPARQESLAFNVALCPPKMPVRYGRRRMKSIRVTETFPPHSAVITTALAMNDRCRCARITRRAVKPTAH